MAGDELEQGPRRAPKRSALRKLLDLILPIDADFDAFCLDHYIEIYRQFSGGMARTLKVNLLIEHADPA